MSTTSSGDLGVFALGLALTGVVSGLVARLLRIGGSIVIVPVLYHVLAQLGVDEHLRMQIAVGTSLAAIVPSACASLGANNSRGEVDPDLLRRWSIPMLLGVLPGVGVAAFASGRTLAIVFGAVAFPVAAWLAFAGESRRITAQPPQGSVGIALPALIGSVSTLMGIDGSILGAPAMRLFGMQGARTTGTTAAFSLIICIPGTIGAIIAGWHAPGLPVYSIGYVNLLGFALLAPTALFAARFDPNIAPLADVGRMRIVFAAFIAIATARMLFDVFA